MSDTRKEAEEKMAKAIFISADCWLCVFDLLTPSQLGLGIALISHRFDFYVDEHFKTRKWALKSIRIHSKIGENGTKEMEIVNSHNGKALPTPKMQLPRKVIGFERINIYFIDRNVIAFLRQLFASFCPINLIIFKSTDRDLESVLRNIWPMIAKNICALELYANFFPRLRKFVPSFLNDFPSLRVVFFYADNFLIEFPADDNTMASDGQSVAKWLFTPRPDNVPKLFKCWLYNDDPNLASKIEAIKTAFANASSHANFIVVIRFPHWPFADSVMPFNVTNELMTNELTREQLVLKRTDNSDHFLLVRCPIVRDESKWTKWEEEAIDWHICDQRNIIDIQIYEEDEIGEGLLDATPGPSDQQK
ncbi:hypothetical protein niasHT_032890 [Heterodera trifolii]|uniref:F-box associated domain-containing protein n=1 Tax=Heterodera trifolii TaxID=157864 RepID=A0ABD2IP04_9BILA